MHKQSAACLARSASVPGEARRDVFRAIVAGCSLAFVGLCRLCSAQSDMLQVQHWSETDTRLRGR